MKLKLRNRETEIDKSEEIPLLENETQSHYRVISFLIIILCMVSVTSFYCFVGHKHLDTWICSYIIDFVFFLAFIFLLEYERKRAKISQNIESTLIRIATGFVAASVVCVGFYWLPSYFKPVVIFVIIMYAVSNSVISVSIGLYFSAIICLFTSSTTYEMVLYVALISISIVWIRSLAEKTYHFFASLCIGLVSFLFPQIFVYLELHNISKLNLLYGGINGVVIFIICYFIFREIRYNTEVEVRNRLDDILSNSYSEVLELKAYSMVEYKHAKIVSELCGKYAKELDLDEELSAAGGFYYRIGKWKGEPHVENGVFFAKKLCFPTDLIVILSEYYGEDALPSSKESALIHIVDATIKKLQALKEEANASVWNTELLIYQTLNEFSQSGIYDKSGLTMNQFLKIREMLAKEEKLGEFLS